MCRVLLGASVADLQAAKQRVDVLTAHLPGADVAFMVQEDPNLMFEELEPSKQSVAKVTKPVVPLYVERVAGMACKQQLGGLDEQQLAQSLSAAAACKQQLGMFCWNDSVVSVTILGQEAAARGQCLRHSRLRCWQAGTAMSSC